MEICVHVFIYKAVAMRFNSLISFHTHRTPYVRDHLFFVNNFVTFFVCATRDVKIVKCTLFRLGQRYKFIDKDMNCFHNSLPSDIYV